MARRLRWLQEMTPLRPLRGARARYGDRSVLVADEDPQTRRYLREALARVGYSAELRSDAGGELLERGGGGGHAFMILRRGTAGLTLLRSLRRRGDRVPVILLSYASPGHDPAPTEADGNVGHLSTPFTVESLQVAIDGLSHFDRMLAVRESPSEAATAFRARSTESPKADGSN
jgi:CheY-like chemotaxis protein